MSDMSKYKEAREWLADTVAGSSPAAALRRVETAAREQRQNYERCAASANCTISLPGYRRSVELLEKALPKLQRAAAAQECARAARDAESKRASDEYMARCARLFPQRR